MAPLFSKIYQVGVESFSSQKDTNSIPPNHTLWKQECHFPELKLDHLLPAHPEGGDNLTDLHPRVLGTQIFCD